MDADMKTDTLDSVKIKIELANQFLHCNTCVWLLHSDCSFVV